MKGLRGTAFDVFGYARVRREERALIGEYRALVERALAALAPATHDAAVALADLPDMIRGYEDIKLDNVRAVSRPRGRARGTAQLSASPDPRRGPRRMRRFLRAVTAMLLVGGCATAAVDSSARRGQAVLRDKAGQEVGLATLTEQSEGVQIEMIGQGPSPRAQGPAHPCGRPSATRPTSRPRGPTSIPRGRSTAASIPRARMRATCPILSCRQTVRQASTPSPGRRR